MPMGTIVHAKPTSSVSYGGVTLLLGLFLIVSTTVVGAQPEPPPALPDATVLATSGETIETVLAEVGLDAAWRSVIDLHPAARWLTVEYRDGEDNVVADLIGTSVALSVISATREEIVADLRTTAVELDTARRIERERSIERNRADAYFRGIHALTQAVAINAFAGTDPALEAVLGLDGDALVLAQREFKLTNTTLDELMDLRRDAETELAAAIVALEAATERRSALVDRHTQLVAEAADLATRRRALDATARAVLPAAAEAFTLASIPGQTGMTPRALDAYLNAELTMTELSPYCGISWRTIAAVASVEGLHGEYGNRRLGLDGRPSSPIIGISLNGVTVDNFGQTTANLTDTDGGRYDRDAVYDRAVGPLQFIPQTWTKWRLDGDGDGERDPQDIDDAALTAAAYLCNYGSLRYWTGWSTAIFGYNQSGAYVNSVKASLDRVQRLELPEFDGDEDLRQRRPWGPWIPLPDNPPAPEADPSDDAVTENVTEAAQ
jgi:transglycosylase-like protein with SLT domain